MPIRHCPHCGEAERLVFAEDARGPIVWCQSCYHVTLGDEPPAYCPNFASDGCRRALSDDTDDRAPCVVCPQRAARRP
jgi:hypothetical protein